MNEQVKKQPYVRPILKQIDLKTDPVLGSCRTGSGSAMTGQEICYSGVCINLT